MKYLSLIIVLLFSVAVGKSYGSEILELIQKGQLDQARKKISELETAVRRDGNLLYYQSLIETDGEQAYQFTAAASQAGLSPDYQEDRQRQIILYHLAAEDYENVVMTAKEYLAEWESGKYRAEIMHLLAVAMQKKSDRNSDYYFNLLVKENQGTLYGQLGRIDQADRLYNQKKYIEAQTICRSLRSSSYNQAATPALYLLAYYSLKQKRIDDAILYYNLLKEGFPYAIGLDELTRQFGSYEKQGSNTKAEELTGTIYSVQVGVFSVKKNAGKLVDRMKAYGKKVETKEKIISDKKYYVVYVGRFISSDKAMAFKAQLEQTENEAYHVVAR